MLAWAIKGLWKFSEGFSLRLTEAEGCSLQFFGRSTLGLSASLPLGFLEASLLESLDWCQLSSWMEFHSGNQNWFSLGALDRSFSLGFLEGCPPAFLNRNLTQLSEWVLIKFPKESSHNLLDAFSVRLLAGFPLTTANITIDRTLQKLCEFGFSEALRETKVCPSTYLTYGSYVWLYRKC
jgi:hypothetical protein